MALAFRYSARLGLCPAEDAERVTTHLKAVGLPHDLAGAHVKADGAALVAHMLHDKKMAAGTLPFLLARGRPDETTSELQSLLRTSNAAFCHKKKQNHSRHQSNT